MKALKNKLYNKPKQKRYKFKSDVQYENIDPLISNSSSNIN